VGIPWSNLQNAVLHLENAVLHLENAVLHLENAVLHLENAVLHRPWDDLNNNVQQKYNERSKPKL